MSSSLDDMYREIILDHYKSPRGKKPLEKTDISSDGMNPSCGDEITVDIEMENHVFKDVHVDCRGCAISTASGSILAEITKGKTFEEVQEIAEAVKKMLKGESEEVPGDHEDLDALKGVRQFPVRIKCALLAWVTLVEGMKNFKDGTTNSKSISTEEEH
ncbi:MAG: SUF system NifU family Fe-S cluster assembly protein [Candidatus Zixiibacteriota bacterium]|nr:MAG: SUF system NifU family Fe-S cluster assembly protein [candidate division Zixibacteria bacterium]